MNNSTTTEYTLSKDSWHAKLMKITFGFYPSDFTHMCPYFWLNVVAVIIAPFTFLIRLPFKWVARTIDNWIMQLRHESYRKENDKVSQLGKSISDKYDQSLLTLEEIAELDEDSYYAFIIYSESKYFDGDLRMKLIQLRNLFEDAEANNKIARKEAINKKLANYKWIATWLVNIIGAAIAITIVFLLGKVIYLAIVNYTPQVGKEVGAFMGIAIGIVLVVYLLVRCFTDFWDQTWSVLKVILYPLIFIGKYAYKFGQLVATMYSNNCPPINWK